LPGSSADLLPYKAAMSVALGSVKSPSTMMITSKSYCSSRRR